MPMPPPAPRCRVCGQPLAALQARHDGLCGRPRCRLQHDRAQQQARRAQAEALMQARWAAGNGATMPPVLWIEAHQARLVPLPAARRQAHLAHLATLQAQLGDHTSAPAPADDHPAPAGATLDSAAATAAGRLCAWCQGRCCRHGADSHAYVDATLLARWLAAHPGSTPQQAGDAYARHLPRRHVQGSCVYHGGHGCTLPPALRSDTCHHFACSGLQQLRRQADTGTRRWLFAQAAQAPGDGEAATRLCDTTTAPPF